MEDHLQILTSLHPTKALSNLVKDIKIASSNFIKETKAFPNFEGGQNGYGAFAYSYDAKEHLIQYIK